MPARATILVPLLIACGDPDGAAPDTSGATDSAPVSDTALVDTAPAPDTGRDTGPAPDTDTDTGLASETTVEPTDVGPEVEVEEPRCSFDCWPTVECTDGTVTAIRGGFWEGPCSESPTSCPGASQTHTCTSGCGQLTHCQMGFQYCADAGNCDLESYCAEGQPAPIGATCATETDCRWPCMPATPIYARCDIVAHVCVAADTPTTPCGGECLGDFDCSPAHRCLNNQCMPFDGGRFVGACP